MRSSLSLVAVFALTLAACGNGADKSATSTASAAPPATSATAAPKKEEPAKDALTVTAKPLTVGMKQTEKETSEVNLKISIDLGGKPKTMETVETETMTRTEEILETDGKAITKARITYTEKKKKVIEDGKEKVKPKNPVDGKTYLVEMKAGKLEVADEKGKKVSKAEEAAVRATNASFGKPDPVATSMPTAAMKVGDKIDGLASAMEQLFKSRDEGKDGKESKVDITGAEVTLASIENPGADAVGVFSIAMTVGSGKDSKEPFTMKAPLKGTLKVRAKDGRLLGVSLAGTMSMEGTDPRMKVSANGEMKVGVEFTY
jgi:hypothetical protein